MRRSAIVGLAAWCALFAAPVIASAQTPAATPTPSAAPTPPPGEPWWVPVAFQGHAVSEVRAGSGQIAVAVDGVGQQLSDDGGRTWQNHFERHGLVAPAQGDWQVRDGRVGRVDATGIWYQDPGSPNVARPLFATAGHEPLAALAAHDGLVVAIDVDNVVWRRGGDGGWSRALLLLNQDALHGPPSVTGVATFVQPLSDAVYMATDGYSVLESTDGGDDWFRAGPGLPDSVLAITTDSSARAVYAATSDGLWVHHLQATPRPPVYRGEDLTMRWVGIAAVCVVASGLSVAGMLRLTRAA